MTHPALIERITRSLAYMLRHQPEEFDLELDAQGYGDSERIVQALNERLGEPVSLADLEDAIHSGDRPRYEIVGTRVRALYGHSIDVEPGEPSRPPEVLHVGISARDADRAMRYGLRGGRRRFLHLALTPDDAKEGGRRTGRDYVVITVYALDAWEEGINFFDRKALFLAEQIPIEFLEIGETCHDGQDADPRGPAPRRENGGDRQRGGGSQRGPSRGREAPAPRQEQAGPGSYEEEGFGEGSSEAIQVHREHRGQQRESGSAADSPRAIESRGETRADRPQRAGGRHAEDRGRRDEPQHMEGAAPRAQHGGERSQGWSDPSAGVPNPRAERDPRDSRPFAGDRQPESSRPVFDSSGERGPREPRRDFDRGARPERQPERQAERQPERQPERAERQPERAERQNQRGERPLERPDRPFEPGGRGGDRETRRPARDERGPDRGERPERFAGDRQEQPMARPTPPERVPEPRPRAPVSDSGPGFGLGIFEEPAVQKRPAPPPQRPVAPPPPPPPQETRERDPSDGFGAGI